MINIYDNVNAVAENLRETAQYKTLRDAIAAVEGEPEAKAIFARFQQAQTQINQAVQSGNEPAEDKIKAWQEVANEMEKYDSLKKMLEAEKGLNQLLMEINDIITKPIAELYGQN